MGMIKTHIVSRFPDVSELVDEEGSARNIGVLGEEADDARPGVDQFAVRWPSVVRDWDIRRRVDVFRQAGIGVGLGPNGGSNPVRVDEEQSDDLVRIIIEPRLDSREVGSECSGVEEETAADGFPRFPSAVALARIALRPFAPAHGQKQHVRSVAQMQLVVVHVTLDLQHPDSVVELRRDRVILVRSHCTYGGLVSDFVVKSARVQALTVSL